MKRRSIPNDAGAEAMSDVLVTGGAGFIGTHVSRLALEAGHNVRILDNLSPQVHGEAADFQPLRGVEFLHGDINSAADLKGAIDGMDTIVHLAAETGTGQSMYDIDRYYRVNVQGTALLFDILANRRHGIRNVILASSRSVYGEGAYLCEACGPQARKFPSPRTPEQLAASQWTPSCPDCGGVMLATATREDDGLAPASIYAASKLAQEELVRVACTAQGLAHAILRLQNVFGEGQSLQNPYTGILSIFSTRIRLGLTLPIFEDGEETRDFVHVEDVANAMIACIDRPSRNGVTLNVGSGAPVSIIAIASLLQKLMGSSIAPHVTGEYRVGDIRHNSADISRLASFGVRPAISLEQGLERFVEWVKTQPIPQDLLDRANAELKARKLMA